VTYGGVLEINAAGTFTAGQNFQLFSGTGAASTSSFAKISTSSGILFGFTNGVLTVVSTLASNPTNITASVSGSTLTITWPADHLGWILQAQTNHLGVGLTTNGWVAVPNSSSGTSSSLPIVPANPAVFYRLSHP
jgi:hypothetical protein